MPLDKCPDHRTLEKLLLGKLPAAEFEILSEHLEKCSTCTKTAETLVPADEVTNALKTVTILRGDEDLLAQAIKRGKELGGQMPTVQPDATVIGPTAQSPAEAHAAEGFTIQNNPAELSFLAPAQQPDELGRLGSYRILQILGVGGMGIVFRAEDPALRRQVALKVMKPSMALNRSAKDRFLREAQFTAAIEHDNIVAIYQVGEDQGVPFIAMPLLKGESLKARLEREGKLSQVDVLRIGREIASGLAAAHERNLIHRDIKPDNIWLEEKTNRARILDFGLVRAASEDAGLTQSGTVMGTPRYMAPEQAMGQDVDFRCDLFSLGAVLYHLVSGKLPFEGSNVTATLVAVVQKEAQPLDKAVSGLHPTLCKLIHKLMAKDRNKRPASAKEVAKLLTAIHQDLRQSANKTPVVGPSVTVADGAKLEAERHEPSGVSPAESLPVIRTEPTSVLPNRKPSARTQFQPNRQPPGTPPRSKSLMALGGGGLLLTLLGIIVITIRDKDGNEIARMTVPGTSSVTMESKAVPEHVSLSNAVDRTKAPMFSPQSLPAVSVNTSMSLTPYEILTSPEFEWTPPENLGPQVNTPAPEQWPTLSSDGLRLIFHSWDRAAIGLSEVTRTRSDEPFGIAQPLGEDFGNNTVQEGASLSGDGLILVFGSLRPGGAGEPGNRNLWQATRPDLSNPFSKPVCLTALNGDGDDTSPWISPDGLSIWFISNRPDNLSGWCWASHRKSRTAEFERPAPIRIPVLPGVENYSHMGGLTLSSDERVLIFAAGYFFEGRHLQNLLMCVRPTRDAKFGTPVNLGPVVNGEGASIHPTLSADGTVLIFQSARPGGVGPDSTDFDLWMSRRAAKEKTGASFSKAPVPAIAPFDAAQANTHQEAWAKYLGVPLEYSNSIGMKFRLIPPGEFMMGSTQEDVNALLKEAGEDQLWQAHLRSETPQHKVILTQPYYLGVHEVTQQAYADVMGRNPSSFALMGTDPALSPRAAGLETSNFPVENVNWTDATEFCSKLSEKESLKPNHSGPGDSLNALDSTGYRLPTEAEWEFACRAGTTTRYWVGDTLEEGALAGWFNTNCGERTHAVGETRANPFGLYDMHGNVSERVDDYWDPKFYGQLTEQAAFNPAGPGECSPYHRGIRGGGWYAAAVYCQSGRRASNVNVWSDSSSGFRVVLPLVAVRQALKIEALAYTRQNGTMPHP